MWLLSKLLKRKENKMPPVYFQTGDLLYFKEKKLPKGKSVKSGELLKSATTGHAHVVKNGQVRKASDGTLWIKVEKEAALHHEEHKSILLPKGFYRVQQVKEYDHFTEEARAVID